MVHGNSTAVLVTSSTMTFTGWMFPNVSSSNCAWLCINVCTAYSTEAPRRVVRSEPRRNFWHTPPRPLSICRSNIIGSPNAANADNSWRSNGALDIISSREPGGFYWLCDPDCGYCSWPATRLHNNKRDNHLDVDICTKCIKRSRRL